MCLKQSFTQHGTKKHMNTHKTNMKQKTFNIETFHSKLCLAHMWVCLKMRGAMGGWQILCFGPFKTNFCPPPNFQIHPCTCPMYMFQIQPIVIFFVVYIYVHIKWTCFKPSAKKIQTHCMNALIHVLSTMFIHYFCIHMVCQCVWVGNILNEINLHVQMWFFL